MKFKLQLISTSNRVSGTSLLVLSLLILIFETPILSRNVSNVVAYGLIGLFIVLNINLLNHLSANKKKAIVSALFYLLYIAILKLLNISSAALSYYSTTVKFLFVCVSMIIVFDKLTKAQKQYLLIFTLMVVVYVLFDNFRLYLRYGAYQFVYLFQNERFTTNSVNTVYVSALMFLAGVLFVYFLHAQKKVYRIVSLALSILFIVFAVVIAQRTIILLLSIGMFPLLMLSNIKSNQNFWIMCMFALIIILLIALNYERILLWAADISGSERIQRRINQLILGLSNGSISETTGSGGARIELMLTSLRTLFSSPLNFFFGAGDHRATTDIIGNHSQFIDEFARYGLVGGSLMLNMMIRFFSAITDMAGVKGMGSSFNRQLRVLFLFFVLRGLLGNMFEPQIAIALFLITPVIFLHLCSEDTVCVVNSLKESSI